MLSPGALTLPLECESSSSLAQSILDHRCTVPLSNLHGLCSCPSIQGPGRNCQLPTAYLSASGRTETLLDYWEHKSKGVKKKVNFIQVHIPACTFSIQEKKHLNHSDKMKWVNKSCFWNIIIFLFLVM